jgi:hypothetical protein
MTVVQKVREEWFSLRENHEKLFRFGLTNCETAIAGGSGVNLAWPVLESARVCPVSTTPWWKFRHFGTTTKALPPMAYGDPEASTTLLVVTV